jgi:hypothetical protein
VRGLRKKQSRGGFETRPYGIPVSRMFGDLGAVFGPELAKNYPFGQKKVD